MNAIDLAELLAIDALAALSVAGISTPAEGYLLAPYLLSGDLAELVKQRDEARAEVERLRGVLASAADLFGALGANLAEIRAGIEARPPCLAPELLEALRKCLSALDVSATPLPEDRQAILEARTQAREAIRKATGGAP